MKDGGAQNGGSHAETLLVIEDDRSLREGLVLNFRRKGYEVIAAADGEQGMRRAFDDHPDLIVLDVMLPGWSGIEILGELRSRGNDVPVLILSARDAIRDKIEGLDLGADDYLAKPFDLQELFARVEALLRRRRLDQSAQPRLEFERVVIDPTLRTVAVAGEPVALSSKEFNLLCLLARVPGRPLTREVILQRVWGWGFEGTARTVDNVILSLRKKIELDPAHPRYIKTVREVGYKFEP